MLAGWEKIEAWMQQSYPEVSFAETSAGLPLLSNAGSPYKEYQALTQSAALVLTADLAPMLVEGSDASDYLHRRLSQSIKDFSGRSPV